MLSKSGESGNANRLRPSHARLPRRRRGLARVSAPLPAVRRAFIGPRSPWQAVRPRHDVCTSRLPAEPLALGGIRGAGCPRLMASSTALAFTVWAPQASDEIEEQDPARAGGMLLAMARCDGRRKEQDARCAPRFGVRAWFSRARACFPSRDFTGIYRFYKACPTK